MRALSITMVVLVLLAGLMSGCARRVPLSELDARGAWVGIRLTTVGGEEVSGRLLSFGGGKVIVEEEGRDGAAARRTFDVEQVSRATFHRERSEAVLGPILSLLIGPVVGVLLAIVL